jgi:hypothetical protein
MSEHGEEVLSCQWDDAVKHYRVQIQNNPNVTIFKFKLAELLLVSATSTDHLLEAKSLFEQVLQVARKQPKVVLPWLAKSQSFLPSNIGPRCQDAIALLLLQSGEEEEAAKLLLPEGFQVRLSRQVVCYDQWSESRNLEIPQYFARAVDNVLPRDMFEFMRNSFNEESPFWREHRYRGWGIDASGYFSYLHEIKDVLKPRTKLEQVIKRIYETSVKQRPEVAEAQYAEWWAHCRPHSAGHQLHFDSDNEGEGGVKNPIISSVLYIDAEAGGPTLVTNQKFGEMMLAQEGCLIDPKENRLGIFDGSLLHGVIPGNGVCPGGAKKLRVTFMVAFWKSTTYASCEDQPCANRRFPYENQSNAEWPKSMLQLSEDWNDNLQPDVSTEIAEPRILDSRNVFEFISRDEGMTEEALPCYDAIFQGF